jgi:hypothetical protein
LLLAELCVLLVPHCVCLGKFACDLGLLVGDLRNYVFGLSFGEGALTNAVCDLRFEVCGLGRLV